MWHLVKLNQNKRSVLHLGITLAVYSPGFLTPLMAVAWCINTPRSIHYSLGQSEITIIYFSCNEPLV